MYAPLAAFLRQEGYTVHAEVLGTDIAARRGEELLLVEMKLRFNLDVLLQAVSKQGAADKTCIAISSSSGKRPQKWSAVKDILRRLGIGLFIVHFCPPLAPQVEEVLAAEDFRAVKIPRKKRKVRAGLIREMEGRPANFNTGGSVKKKIVTAYLVNSLRVAVLLRKNQKRAGEPPARGGKSRPGLKAEKTGASPGLSPQKLRELGAPQNCGSILYNNFHGWFERLGTGSYALGATGKAALREYRDVIKSLERFTAKSNKPKKES
ncbi:MAG: DUF2161 family putative PD-(D/E)XK-type phosphodiesterase [Spirochaetales bacterium]|nr:DUF2161 family putative PD-(D/E)XK-type phosphodiesterase [Spirochaetales bacterium]